MTSSGESAIRSAIVNATEAEGEHGVSRDLRSAKKLLNDTGNSERLEGRFGRDLMSVPELGRLWWTGSCWSTKGADKEWALAAQKTARAMVQREASELEAGLGGSDDKSLQKFREWALESGNRARLTAMQAILEPRVEVSVQDLDANPFLFNAQNGTLELGTETDPTAIRLRRHSRRDRITRIAPIGYEPDAECPLWRSFLDRVLPDRDVQDWLQRWLGYLLTASYAEHKLVIMWGDGRNGKGVLTKTIQWLLGDYAAIVQFQTFIDAGSRRGGEPSPDLAKLVGVRAVFASEAKKGARLDDGLIKQLTGGDPAAVRKLNRDFFDLSPTFKINLICNNKPQIRDDTHGMWSRVILVAFLVTIPEAEIDKDLSEKLKREGPGILNYCLDGFRMYRERGLTPPAAILAATAEYRSESDRIGQFLETATVSDTYAEIPASEFYACYEVWCRAMEYRSISQTKFGIELTKRGIPSVKRGIYYRLGRKWNPEKIDWDWQAPYE